ncbi:ATP-binding protein [Nocardioides hankookensis]|uniref:Sensor-like histidine kinase SenX3 n=1 Tax=Nocardioides hankookensis TaxID=443157 RepID=A0ABW1LPD6_9ACTN
MGGGPESGAMPHVQTTSRNGAGVGLGFSVLFAVVFVVTSTVTRRIELSGAGFSQLWPAGGLPVLWLLLRQGRGPVVDSVLVLCAAFAANLIAGSDAAIAMAFAVANLVQSWLAVLLLRRWCPETWGCGGDRPLDTPRTVARFGAALAVSMAVGTALASVGAVLLPGAGDAFDPVASGLWFGRNLGSALIVVALGIMIFQRVTSPRPWPPLRGVDGGPSELLVATLFTIFMYGLAFSLDDLPLAFPLLAATVWYAARFSTLLSAAHSFVVGLATMMLTLQGVGPFARVDDPDVGFMIAQFYIATIALTGLAIATGRDERQALADDLRRAQEATAYEGSVRAAVIGSMTEGVLVVDERGDLLVHNEAAARVLGVGDELSTDTRFSLSSWTLDGVEMELHERPTARALRGERVENELMVVQVDGVGERVLTVSAIPLPRDERQGRTRALVLLRDTTNEHASRQELSAFAGVVAHDLRNPLAAIDGWTEMIADELDNGALDAQLAREFVSRVRSSSRRMRELIRDLLAHATSSSRDLEVGRVDVTAMVEEIVVARNAQAFVSVDAVPPVLADPVLVRQVLDNLVGNALKYVEPGEDPKISVHGCRSDARLVTIGVTDHGIGIPEEERERVFEEFHRAHYREYEGSGLGLSIVRRIVNRHGGTIEALPNPAGRGSVFRFTLPAFEA